MTHPPSKRCRCCGEILGNENFNGSRRSQDGLASTCRVCVNRRRRERRHRDQQTVSLSVDLVRAARRGQLDVIQAHVTDNPRQLQNLLWKTVQDFHSIKKRPEHVAQARFLIERGAQPHWNMIGEAAKGGHQPLIDVLLESGVETNIFVAAATGDENRLAELLNGAKDLARAHERGMTPLHYCGMSALGKADVARAESIVRCAERLVQAGAEIEAKADSPGVGPLRPLHCVCWTGGNRGLARLLLEQGADPKGCLIFALGHFQRHGDGNYDIAELLLGAGIEIHEEGDDALGRLAAHGDALGVRWLLEHGANPNVRSEEGRTPLHFAAERNTGITVIKLLLEHGADKNATTIDGRTPLYLSQQNNKRRVAEYLQDAGALA